MQDVTEDELLAFMQKCGIVGIDPLTGKLLSHMLSPITAVYRCRGGTCESNGILESMVLGILEHRVYGKM